ncbi:MAG: 5,6-dimethylbenzimidazole synthase, partial [Candidatus Binataceae bacterium]
RQEVRCVFEEERRKNAAQFSGARRDKFFSLKLEGILEAPLNLIVTCKPERFGPGVLGKVSITDVEMYSACLAVGNLWLAARAEGLGVGWVSIVRNEDLHRIFGIPAGIIPIAYLCVGYPVAFPPQPLLESAQWAARLPPSELLHFDSWDNVVEPRGHVAEMVRDPRIWRGFLPTSRDAAVEAKKDGDAS